MVGVNSRFIPGIDSLQLSDQATEQWRERVSVVIGPDGTRRKYANLPPRVKRGHADERTPRRREVTVAW
jgi:hypothetical protein